MKIVFIIAAMLLSSCVRYHDVPFHEGGYVFQKTGLGSDRIVFCPKQEDGFKDCYEVNVKSLKKQTNDNYSPWKKYEQ